MNMRSRVAILRDLAEQGLDTNVAYVAGKGGKFVRKKLTKAETKTAKNESTEVVVQESSTVDAVEDSESSESTSKEETLPVEKTVKKKMPPPKKKKTEQTTTDE